MPGPYFRGQSATACGCYFPDVTRLLDDEASGERVLYCETHGEYRVPCEKEAMVRIKGKIPTPAERQALRETLQQDGQDTLFVAVPRDS